MRKEGDEIYNPKLFQYQTTTIIPHYRVHGTRPYLPDEFLRGHRLSPKVDVYSFGVVLFELVTGLSAYDNRRKQRFLKDHVVEYCTENPTDLGKNY